MRELPRRKQNRLKGYDYSRKGAYFLTICTKNRYEMLGRIIDKQSVLNEYGLIVKQEIENIPAIRKECVIDYFVIMPNHVHIIVRIVGDNNNCTMDKRADYHPPLGKSVSNMVQGLKGAVTRCFLDLTLIA